MNKKFLAVPLLITSLALSSCGSPEKFEGNTVNNAFDNAVAGDAAVNDEGAEEAGDGINTASVTAKDIDSAKVRTDEMLKKEMLVYSCNIDLEVLEFDAALGEFKKSIDTYGAFIEREEYTDGGSGGRWYDENEQKWQSYRATIRVPSENYEKFCDNAAGLGNLRSKNASVENMSREYSDLSTTLEIYQAKEKRYLELLKDITDNNKAIAVEEELTQIQIEIAKLKTRMSTIRQDVAYSFVYVSINEVKEYVEHPEPVKTDTFFQRLGNTVSETASGFISFMEKLLFFIIRILPYALLIGIVTFVVSKIRKAFRKKSYKSSDIPPVIRCEPAPGGTENNAPADVQNEEEKTEE